MRRLALLPAAAALLAVSACGESAPTQEPLSAAPLAGASIGGDFTLVDKNGDTVEWKDFAGQWRIVYFGYTFCPDVCPVDAAAIGGALTRFEKTAPELAAKVTPIFITVDPERDTPEVVGEFASAFHPRMVGLTGTTQQVKAAADQFVVYYELQKPNAEGGYLVDHSNVAMLFDPDGNPIAILSTQEGADKVASELERWVR